MSTKTPTSDTDEERVTVTNELLTTVKQLGIPRDSKRAHQLAKPYTEKWLRSTNGSYSHRKLHIPDPDDPLVPVCDHPPDDIKEKDVACFPPGHAAICNYCFAWLLTVHYPELLDQVGDQG